MVLCALTFFRISALALLLLLGGCSGFGDTPAKSRSYCKAQQSSEFDPLLLLSAERLTIAADVAKAKWNSKAPILDEQREAAVTQTFVANAIILNVNPELAKRYILAQIAASKTVQFELFEQWAKQQQPPFSQAPDLTKDIRPRLDQLTPQILSALAKLQPLLSESERAQTISCRQQFLFTHYPYPAALELALQPIKN